jgi:hypothetical protein
MKKRLTLAGLAALVLSGCAMPYLPAPMATAATVAPASPADRKALLEAQSRGLRTKIVQLKQEVMVFEGMLTDVERRAAMSQVSLSSLPSTEVAPKTSVATTAPPARREDDRLSVTVRPEAVKPAEARKKPQQR